MKKIVVFATIVFVFAACFNPWRGDEGDLSIGIGSADGGPLTEINGIPIENFRHIITLSDGPGVDQTIIIDGPGTVNFSVIPGHWTITITTYVTTERDGTRTVISDPIASGSVRVEIKPGPNDVVPIEMGWYNFTVSFESNGGSEVASQPLSYGEMVSEPDVSKTGHDFEGWYTEEAFSYQWDFGTDIVTRNITLYAQWTKTPPEIFTVSFVSHGGTEVSDQKITEGETASQPYSVTRGGFVLEGWYKDYYKDNDNNDIFENKWNFDNPVTAHLALHARWIVSVTDITSVPKTMVAGQIGGIDLGGDVQPADATNKTISWSLKNQGTTQAELENGKLITWFYGIVVVTATIENGINTGIDYTKDFVIIVQDPNGLAITFPDIVDNAPIKVDQIISRSGNNGPKYIELTVDNSTNQYSSIAWYVTGTDVSGISDTFILDSAHYSRNGEYNLTLEVWKDGKPYSKNIIFTVMP